MSQHRMATPHRVYELRRVRDHTVILLVSVVDRRIVPALRLVSRLACTDSRALHVAVDPDKTRRLAADWMNLGLTWLPLHIREATDESLTRSVRDVVEQEASAAGSLTVVVPELDLGRWWQPLLHSGSARRIAAHLQALPGVTPVIVPLRVPRQQRIVIPRRR